MSIVVDSLDNVPQFTWDTEAGTVTDHTVTPPVTRAITSEEMLRFAPPAEPISLTVDPQALEETYAVVQEATSVNELKAALSGFINAIKQVQ